MLRQIAKAVETRPFWFSVICGALATLTLPPVFFFPLLIPAFSGLLLLLISAITPKQAFWRGWGFGLGYFVTGLYWFAYALLVDAEKFAWMIPFAVLGLPSVLAIYYGIAGYFFWQLNNRLQLNAFLAVLFFSFLWFAIEWLRGHLFTGFPWNLISLSWASSLPMLQLVSVIGSYGLVWWTVLLAALPAVIYWPDIKQRCYKNLALVICLTMLLIQYSVGMVRLGENNTQWTNYTITLVQPNISQAMKWKPEQRIATIEQHVAMSMAKSQKPQADAVIWSESAYPYFLQPHSPPINYIVSKVLNKGGRIITGAVRSDDKKDVYNSLAVIESDGAVSAYYDKVKLVPFGEFVPLRVILPINKITHGMKDFSAGKHGQLITIAGLPPFFPLICYEIIFPELAQPLSQNTRPEWLLNITNDGWFGISSGPYQHFYTARMRAVEQGLPVVRVANSGISGVMDSYGRITALLPLHREGVLTTKLPKSISKTLFSRVIAALTS